MSNEPGHHGEENVQLPKVLVDAALRYLIGLPLIVVVTYDNRSNPVEFYDLPDLNLFSLPSKIGLDLEPMNEGTLVHVTPRCAEEHRRGIELHAGELRQMVLDLSNFGLSLQPGTYHLTLFLREWTLSSFSNSVTVQLVRPVATDAREATRLRGYGHAPSDTGAWAPFLRNNWHTVTPSPALSDEAQRQLALHLFLHRAFYGPDPVAQLDDTILASITEGNLSAEIAALHYEILAAKGDPSAKQARDDLLVRWPGMRHRVELAKGLIASGRQWFGAEKPSIKPQPTPPYL